MRLEFVKRHLSIFAFPPIDVPALTIVVGINGSGKTHLLQAIQNGSVSNSVAPLSWQPMPIMNDGPVRLLSLATNSTTEVVAYSSSEMHANPGMMAMQRGGNFEAARRTTLSPYATRLDQLTSGRISQSLGPNDDIWRMGIDEAVKRGGDETYRSEIELIFQDAEAELLKAHLPNANPPHNAQPNPFTHHSLQRVSFT